MRKVSYYIEKYNHTNLRLEKVKCNGWFHQWGIDFISQDDGTANQYTIGIVEDSETGEVKSLEPDNITFLDKPE